MDDDLKTTAIKGLIMLAIIAAEWWAMQPYHEPVMARIWLALARWCQRMAYRLGMLGLEFEYRYSEALP